MNHMKYIIAVAFSLLILGAEAQQWRKVSSLEFGIMAGGSNYQGELTNSFFESKGTHLALGILTRYNPNERITFRLQATRGTISGDDQWYPDVAVRTRRNLDFQSVLWDFRAGLDFNLRVLDYKQTRGIIPYVTTGISVFRFNPMSQFFYDPGSPHLNRVGSSYGDLANRNEEWVELQPLSTEGQQTTQYNDRERYSLTQIAIPLGAGVKFRLSEDWVLSLEYVIHKTFTDYLDDVSSSYIESSYIEGQYGPMAAAMADRSPSLNEAGVARGDDGNTDWYSIFGVNLTYRINLSGVRCPEF
jgi:opacity protein-like surface antigen